MRVASATTGVTSATITLTTAHVTRVTNVVCTKMTASVYVALTMERDYQRTVSLMMLVQDVVAFVVMLQMESGNAGMTESTQVISAVPLTTTHPQYVTITDTEHTMRKGVKQ